MKVETIFPHGTEGDVTVTLDESGNNKDWLIFNITTSENATAKDYLIRFEVVCLVAGNSPVYQCTHLHVRAAN